MVEGISIQVFFFHKIIIWKMVKNSIRGIHNDNGWCGDINTIREVIRSMFRDRFSEGNIVEVLLDNMLFIRIGEVDNAPLTKEIIEKEVRITIWECDGAKTSDPDGYTFNFIKQACDVIKCDIFRAILAFYNVNTQFCPVKNIPIKFLLINDLFIIF